MTNNSRDNFANEAFLLSAESKQFTTLKVNLSIRFWTVKLFAFIKKNQISRKYGYFF